MFTFHLPELVLNEQKPSREEFPFAMHILMFHVPVVNLRVKASHDHERLNPTIEDFPGIIVDQLYFSRRDKMIINIERLDSFTYSNRIFDINIDW